MFSKSKLSVAILSALMILGSTACGGGGSGSDGSSTSSEVNTDTSANVDESSNVIIEDEIIPTDDSGNSTNTKIGNADTSLNCSSDTVSVVDTEVVSGIDILIGPYETELNFVKKIKNGGSYGTTAVAETGNYVYTFKSSLLNSDFSGVKDEITYYDSDCNLHSRTISLYSDPLASQEWHQRSNGSQNAYSVAFATQGVDVNVYPAWKTGADGTNVTVAIIDKDLDTAHEDLKHQVSGDNVYCSGCSQGSDSHGTSVAGIIAAESANDKGVRGIAFGAKVRGYIGYLNDLSTFPALYTNEILTDKTIKVINGSWGYGVPKYLESPSRENALDALADANVAYIKSSSNYFKGATGVEFNTKCMSTGLNCFYAGTADEDVYPATIVTGAVSHTGAHASYSSDGSNLLVSAPGAETGTFYPRILTTDYSGCYYGNSSTLAATDFLNGSLSDNDSCNYTNAFVGTSAATPVVAGVAALLYSEVPNLTIWQLRYALAKTARNNSTIEGMNDPIVKQQGVVVNQGWVENASGLKFSNRFGFGLVDAAEALTLAKSCNSNVSCKARGSDPVEFSTQDVSCEEDNATTILNGTYTCTVKGFYNSDYDSQKNYELENVTIDIGNTSFQSSEDSSVNGASICTDATFKYSSTLTSSQKQALSELQIELVSGKGTTSILKGFYTNYFGAEGGVGLRLLTNAFMGESFDPSENMVVRFRSTCYLDNVMKNAVVTVRAFEK